MKKVFSVILVGVYFLGAQFAQAQQVGGRESGGGKGIVCRNPRITPTLGNPNNNITGPVLGLDLYEAKTRGIKMDLGDASLSVQQKVQLGIDRLRKLGDTTRADQYTATAKLFFSAQGTRFLSKTKLTDTEDSFELSFPDNCHSEQIIIQSEPQFAEDRLFTISKDLWDRLDKDNQAVMALHEIIYREARADGATNSYLARYFNSYIFSNKISQYSSIDKYAQILLKFGFNSVTFGNVDLVLETSDGTDVSENLEQSPVMIIDNIVYGMPMSLTPVHIDGIDFSLNNELMSAMEVPVSLHGYTVSFYRNGALKSFIPVGAYSTVTGGTVSFAGLQVGSQVISFDVTREINLYKDGHIQSATLHDPFQATNIQGVTVSCHADDLANFTDDGTVISCE